MIRFKLHVETPPEWVARVEENLSALLSDHAHCELQAAISAQTLIAKNTRHTKLVRTLAGLAREEMAHFMLVVDLIEACGERLARRMRNEYVEELLARTAELRADKLTDRLIVSGLIEARSFERFRLLAEHLADRELATVYRSLMASEAGHSAQFGDLVSEFGRKHGLEERVERFTQIESEVIGTLPFDYRMHSGLAPESHSAVSALDASRTAARTSGS